MSRFFAASSTESETESDDSVDVPAPAASKPAPRFTYMSDSDSEDDHRVVKSAADKRNEELAEIVKRVKNHKKNKDMAAVLKDFEDLVRAYEKNKKVDTQIPQVFIKTLVEVEDFVNAAWDDKDLRKNMSKPNAKGLTTLRQRVRRYNKEFQNEIDNYRDTTKGGPEEVEEAAEDQAEEEESDYDEEDEEGGRRGKVRRSESERDEEFSREIRQLGGDESDESDEDEWESSSSESSSSDDEGLAGSQLTAAFFLKKPEDMDDEKEKEKSSKPKPPRKTRVKVFSETGHDDDAARADKDGWVIIGRADEERPRLFVKEEDMTFDNVYKKFDEFVKNRGKRLLSRQDMMAGLEEMALVTHQKKLGSALMAKILFCMISAIFDSKSSMLVAMAKEPYAKLVKCVQQLLELLQANLDLIVSDHIVDEEESLKTAPFKVRGDPIIIVEQIDEEYTKLLQSCDAHSNEYIDRLKDGRVVDKFIDQLITYLESNGRAQPEELCKAYLKKVQHMYYLAPAMIDAKLDEETTERMERLCHFIYENDKTDRLKVQAVLCHVYYNAIHDRWYEARDLLLTSQIPSFIDRADIPVQMLYNRAVAQLGLCAFRRGLIPDAHQALVNLQSSARARELLGQGIVLLRGQQKTKEQEQIERMRQLPFHMHINLELLEFVYLVSAMLVELPVLALVDFGDQQQRRRGHFFHVLKQNERTPFNGPPDTMREHVVAAAKALRIGDWRTAMTNLYAPKMATKVWSLIASAESVKTVLTAKLKECGLMCYVFTNSAVYSNMSLSWLSTCFDLDLATVQALVSRMIINGELKAWMDEPSGCLLLRNVEVPPLHAPALDLSRKLAHLADATEKLWIEKQSVIMQTRSGGAVMGSGFVLPTGAGGQQHGQQWGGRRGQGDRQGGDRGDRQGQRREYRNRGGDGNDQRNRDRDYQQ